jgi:hypothetical protein
VLFDSRELDLMVQQDFLKVDKTWSRRLRRYATLQHRADLETVSLYLKPLRPSAGS